jgi:hypothetical protein
MPRELEDWQASVDSTVARRRLFALADLCDIQAQRRRLPAGEDPDEWARSWYALGHALRKIA